MTRFHQRGAICTVMSSTHHAFLCVHQRVWQYFARILELTETIPSVIQVGLDGVGFGRVSVSTQCYMMELRKEYDPITSYTIL